MSILECPYRKELGLCLLRSLYEQGHRHHTFPNWCVAECGPEDTHKLGMLNNVYGEILLSLPSPEETERIVEEKREEYLLHKEQDKQLKMPSLLDEAKELGKTVVEAGKRVLKGQSPVVSKEEKDRRQAICVACEKYSKEKERCTLCGCFMNIKNWVLDGQCRLGKWDSRLVSVIIPSRKDPYLARTIASIERNAHNPIEIIALEDRKGEGYKVLRDRGVEQAKGDFVFIVDSHCTLSDNWDGLLKLICGPKDLVVSTIGGLDEKKWELDGSYYGRVYINRKFQEKWWDNGKGNVLPTMALTGCGWMMMRKRYQELEGHMYAVECPYGGDGAEWGLKTWLSGGRCFLRRDVICGHLFRDKNPFPVDVESIEYFYQQLAIKTRNHELPLQDRSMDWLVGKFDPVPTWYGADK